MTGERTTCHGLVTVHDDIFRYPLPRPETRTDILRRGLALYPELAPPEVRQVREPKVEDLVPLVIEDACGLRPARKSGPRLEAQMVKTKGGRSVPLIFNYGCV
jgi:D-amino-acid oxidase